MDQNTDVGPGPWGYSFDSAPKGGRSSDLPPLGFSEEEQDSELDGFFLDLDSEQFQGEEWLVKARALQKSSVSGDAGTTLCDVCCAFDLRAWFRRGRVTADDCERWSLQRRLPEAFREINPLDVGTELMHSFGILRNISQKSHCSLCRLITRFAERAYPGIWNDKFMARTETEPQDVLVVAYHVASTDLRDFREPSLHEPVSWYTGLCFKVKTGGELPDSDRFLVLGASDSEAVHYNNPHKSKPEKPLYGARLLPDKIDFQSIKKQWLGFCQRSHTHTKCAPRLHEDLHARHSRAVSRPVGGIEDSSQGTPSHAKLEDEGASVKSALPLRVIDVERRLVIDAPPSCEFVALSYVWGTVGRDLGSAINVSSSELDTLKNLEGKGSDMSKSLPDTLPQTIEDALVVTRNLGQRYLWVDVLCIDQANLKEMDGQVANMHLIYGRALVTLVAADGEDAESGLSSVHGGSDCRDQISEIVDGVRVFMSQPMLAQELFGTSDGYLSLSSASSKWVTRAWCYQEGLLAARLLIFTGSQVFWKCSQELLSESVAESPEHVRFWAKPAPYHELLCSPLLPTPSESDDNRKRSNSPQWTVYCQFVEEYSRRDLSYQSDAMKAFSGIAHSLAQSSLSHYVWCLPQEGLDWALLWRPWLYTSMQRQGFPTWSWLSCQGGVTYTRDLNQSWNAFSTDHAIRVHDYRIEDNEGHHHHVVQKAYRRDTAGARLHQEAGRFVEVEVEELAYIGWLKNAYPPKTYEENVGELQANPTQPQPTLSPYLHFRTECAKFRIFAATDGRGSRYVRIGSPDDSSNDLLMRLALDYVVDASRLEGTLCEFILLSRYESFDADLLDSAEGLYKEVHALNVMMVERRDGQGETLYRLGVGKVPVRLWADARPEMRDVKLG